MSRGRRFLIFRLPLLLYLALIFYMSSGPVSSPFLKRFSDYILHMTEYCGLYLLMFRALHEGWHPRPRRGGYWLAMILTVLYGISDELHQSFVPTRDCSVLDVLSDSVGAVVGILALVVFERVISSWWTRASLE
jgi:VanZ family protein